MLPEIGAIGIGMGHFSRKIGKCIMGIGSNFQRHVPTQTKSEYTPWCKTLSTLMSSVDDRSKFSFCSTLFEIQAFIVIFGFNI